MRKQKWTPEPWHVVPEYTGCNGEEVTAGIYDDDDGSPNLMIGEFEDRADAARAIRCLNALAGVEDPAAYVSRVATLEAEVAALKEACVEYMEWAETYTETFAPPSSVTRAILQAISPRST